VRHTIWWWHSLCIYTSALPLSYTPSPRCVILTTITKSRLFSCWFMWRWTSKMTSHIFWKPYPVRNIKYLLLRIFFFTHSSYNGLSNVDLGKVTHRLKWNNTIFLRSKVPLYQMPCVIQAHLKWVHCFFLSVRQLCTKSSLGLKFNEWILQTMIVKTAYIFPS
jgi:hypothetical protein